MKPDSQHDANVRNRDLPFAGGTAIPVPDDGRDVRWDVFKEAYDLLYQVQWLGLMDTEEEKAWTRRCAEFCQRYEASARPADPTEASLQ